MPIKLYQYPNPEFVINLSPFCAKLETYLKMAGIEYEVIKTLNPSIAPKKKLPFIDDEGFILADSGLIIGYLKANYGNPLDQHLTRHQNALRIAFERLIEEHLYWQIVYSRWIDQRFWPEIKKNYFSNLLFPIRSIVALLARRNIKKQLYHQGMGRHTKDEIYTFGKVNLESISLLLGNKAYLLSDEPSSLDATTFGFLINIIDVPQDTPLKEHALKLENLKPYLTRIKNSFFQNKDSFII